MEPFVDRSIGLIERPQTIVIGAPEPDTIAFDPYRQGIEVTRMQYFLQSNMPYMSSKGLKEVTKGVLLNHELDHTNFGQGINLDGFEPFDDKYEIKDASTVLRLNIYQDNEDPYFGRASQDGEISIFSDTGKRSLLPELDIVKSRGIRGTLSFFGGPYAFNDKTEQYCFDAAELILGVPVPGYGGSSLSFAPFVDSIDTSSLGSVLTYSYIGPKEKSPTTGFDYYGSNAGTDSISYGGFLR